MVGVWWWLLSSLARSSLARSVSANTRGYRQMRLHIMDYSSCPYFFTIESQSESHVWQHTNDLVWSRSPLFSGPPDPRPRVPQFSLVRLLNEDATLLVEKLYAWLDCLLRMRFFWWRRCMPKTTQKFGHGFFSRASIHLCS